MSAAALETLLRAAQETAPDEARVDSAAGELATVLRSAEERTALGPQLIPACCALLRSTQAPSIGVIRALGNVCVDNGSSGRSITALMMQTPIASCSSTMTHHRCLRRLLCRAPISRCARRPSARS